MRVQITILAVLLATSLAGCLESGDEPTEDSTEETQSLDTNVTNIAPVASLLADASNGTAPLNVTFTLEASDADGDNLTWSFDDGTGNTTQGNGSALPATVNATYLAGNWSAVFTVSDGSNETVETIMVSVAEAAENAGEAVGNATEGADVPEPITWGGTATNIDGICLVLPIGEWLYYEAAYAGVWMYKAEGSTPDGSGMLTDWWIGDDRIGFEGSEGVIPAGSDNVAVCPELPGVPADFTLTLYHPDYVFE